MRINFENQNNQMNVAKFGAHEALEARETLSDAINSINQFELYRPHVKDSQLAEILDRQLDFMVQEYNGMVNYLQRSGKIQSRPYQTQNRFSPKYGLRNPAPGNPNLAQNQLNDHDIAHGMLGCAKSSAVFATLAALECTDPELRNMMKQCIVNKVDMAYEIFRYMNQ